MSRLRLVAAALIAAALAGAGAARAQDGQLVDRVVAVVSGTIITMTDARAALDFGFVTPGAATDPVADAVRWLIDRQLVLDEAARYGAAVPDPARVDEALAALRARTSPEALAARLATLGLTEADLRLLVRQNLLMQSYIDRRFDATMAVTENEAQEYYRLRVDRFVRDGRLLSFDEARDEVYGAIARERRERALNDWLVRLRRRSEVNELYVPRRQPGPTASG